MCVCVCFHKCSECSSLKNDSILVVNLSISFKSNVTKGAKRSLKFNRFATTYFVDYAEAVQTSVSAWFKLLSNITHWHIKQHENTNQGKK